MEMGISVVPEGKISPNKVKRRLTKKRLTKRLSKDSEETFSQIQMKKFLDVASFDTFKSPKNRYQVSGLVRNRLNILLNDPRSSFPALMITVFIQMVIIISVMISIISTCAGYSTLVEDLQAFLTFAAIVFTFELIVRCTVQYNSFMEALTDIFLYIDVFAVAGFWLIQFGLPIPHAFVNLMRAGRLLKVCRNFEGTYIIATAIEESMGALKVPLFFLGVSATTFGTLLFYIEDWALSDETKEPGDLGNAFTSIPHCIWFMFVTMSTVGYGDVYPNSDWGRGAAVVAINFGVMYMAMPLAIIGGNFARVWEDRSTYKAAEKLREMVEGSGTNRASYTRTFESMDHDGSGHISREELRVGLLKAGLDISRRDLQKVWKAIDVDGNGVLDRAELLEFLFPNSPQQKLILDLPVSLTRRSLPDSLCSLGIKSGDANIATGALGSPPPEGEGKRRQPPSMSIDTAIAAKISNGTQSDSVMQGKGSNIAMLANLREQCLLHMDSIGTRFGTADTHVAKDTHAKLMEAMKAAVTAMSHAERALSMATRLQELQSAAVRQFELSRKLCSEVPGRICVTPVLKNVALKNVAPVKASSESSSDMQNYDVF